MGRDTPIAGGRFGTCHVARWRASASSRIIDKRTLGEASIVMNYESKVREFYDSATHCYESIMGYTWHHGDPEAEAKGLSVLEACQALEKKMMSLSGLKAGQYALDFGSGVGGPTLYMAKLTSAHFVGVANNELCNQKARARAMELGLSELVNFITVGDTDYKHLPFADGTFDCVTFYESVCHLPDKAAFFREVFRVLKSGSRLVGIDWLQRPFGENQTEEQIMKFMRAVNEAICIPWHGSVEGYSSMIEEAGFQVLLARDLFDGVKCWGSTPDRERPQWLNYDGPEAQRFRLGKQVLDEARESGVFTVGMFVAAKPAST
jgi:tocopherol O-methyltransferase